MSRQRLLAWIVSGLAVAAAAAGCAQAQAGGQGVLIFAAASLQTALDELQPALERASGTRVVMSYAASSALARQIESGAPADLFISADLDWMDYLDRRGLIRRDSRVNLVGNQLVLVAPARASIAPVAIAPGFPLAALLGSNRLAVANPDSVPAGTYAKAALTSLGVWDSVQSRLAAAENVRAGLVLVSRGECPLGIVYRTDAAADPGVRIVGVFPDRTHAPIVYPAALTATAAPQASRVLAYLQSQAAMAVFRRQGFTDLE
jgi:molybdate transport system substrate-binding protein